MPVAITISPEVAVAPPKFSVPVKGIPFFVSSLYSPKGTCQIILPLLRLRAVRVPQGGVMPGYPSKSSNV